MKRKDFFPALISTGAWEKAVEKNEGNSDGNGLFFLPQHAVDFDFASIFVSSGLEEFARVCIPP